MGKLLNMSKKCSCQTDKKEVFVPVSSEELKKTRIGIYQYLL
jgi:hypothetical protein